MIKKLIALSLYIAVLSVIPVFADSGYQHLSALTDAPNLAVTQRSGAYDSTGDTEKVLKALDGNTKSTWKASGKTDSLTLEFDGEQTFNTIVLREQNWNIKQFHLSYYDAQKGRWEQFYTQDKVEDYRYCTFDPVTTSALRFEVTQSNAPFKLRELEVYFVPEKELDDFRVTSYLSLAMFNEEQNLNPDSPEYLHPDYFDTVNQVIFFLGNWDGQGGHRFGEMDAGGTARAHGSASGDYRGSGRQATALYRGGVRPGYRFDGVR